MAFSDPVKYRAYQAEYNRRPEVRARKKAWAETEKGRAYYAEYFKVYGTTQHGLKTRAKAAKRQRAKGRSAIIEAKSIPCMDCGGTFHHCQMQFDHRPGSEKKFAIGSRAGMGPRSVRAEIEKCDVVCANCHSLRTWTRLRERATQ